MSVVALVPLSNDAINEIQEMSIDQLFINVNSADYFQRSQALQYLNSLQLDSQLLDVFVEHSGYQHILKSFEPMSEKAVPGVVFIKQYNISLSTYLRCCTMHLLGKIICKPKVMKGT